MIILTKWVQYDYTNDGKDGVIATKMIQSHPIYLQFYAGIHEKIFINIYNIHERLPSLLNFYQHPVSVVKKQLQFCLNYLHDKKNSRRIHVFNFIPAVA